jgi:hypothetical protein
MAISFPFEFVDLGVPVPFKILPNPDFPTETEPVCILENQGVPPGPDTFITTGTPPLPFPNDPDPWSLTFHWATAGAATAGEWQIDAFLEGVSAGVANIIVPATTPGPVPFIVPGGSPHHYNITFGIPAGAIKSTAPGVFLFRLYATLRWAELPGPRVRVSGRAIGPLMDFYFPA